MSDSTLGKKGLVNVRGQKRMARRLCADRKTTVTPIATCCNQKSISEYTAR